MSGTRRLPGTSCSAGVSTTHGIEPRAQFFVCPGERLLVGHRTPEWTVYGVKALCLLPFDL